MGEIPKISTILDRFVFNIGITGHRKIPVEKSTRISAQITEILELSRHMVLFLSAQGRRELGIYSSEPEIKLISCLSEGTDRLAATCAFDLGIEVVASLPFPLGSPVNARDLPLAEKVSSRRELKELCKKASAVLQLNPQIPYIYDKLDPGVDMNDESQVSAAFRQKAYFEAGMIMLDRIDLLIAVWSGIPQASEGSTWDVICHAIKSGKPVLWINSSSDVPVSLILTEEDLLSPSFCTASQLEDVLFRVYGVPENELDGLRLIFRELDNSEKTPFLAKSWGKFQKSITDKAVDNMPNGPYRDDTCPDFLIFDRAATSVANKHRSSMLGFALKSLLIVVATALASAWPIDTVKTFVDIISGITAIILIITALWYTATIQKKRWQYKLGLFRCIAEMLRVVSFANPVGVYCSLNEIKTFYGSDKLDSKQKWLTRNLMRLRGFPNADLSNSNYVEQHIDNISNYLLLSQICYHRKNSRRSLMLSRLIDKISIYIFWISLSVIVFQVIMNVSLYAGYNINSLVSELMLPVLVFVGVIGPVLVTAAQYIRINLELYRLAIRSEKLADSLEDLRVRLLKDKTADNLRSIMKSSADLMIKDVVDWKEQTTLPKESI